MKLTGQKLQERRESLGLTISEVSLATKINPKVLVAMESGDQEHLPAKTFLRGFVKAYAVHLKMNPDEILAIFSQELGEAKKETAERPQAAPTSSGIDVHGEGSNSFRMVLVAGIVTLIVLIIGVRSLIQKYERERAVDTTTEVSTPIPQDPAPANVDTATQNQADSKVADIGEDDSKSEDAATDNPKEDVKPVEATTPPPQINQQATLPAQPPKVAKEAIKETPKTVETKPNEVKKEAPKVAEVKSAPVINKEAPKAAEVKAPVVTNKEAPKVADAKSAPVISKEVPKAAEVKSPAVTNKEAPKVADAKSALVTNATPPNKSTTQPQAKAESVASADITAKETPKKKEKRHEIILEALDKVDVKFELNGKKKSFSLVPNQVHTIVAEGPLLIDLSDGGAVNITDNGVDRGTPGDLGRPKQIKIP